MPRPRQLVQDRALAGWVWETGQGERFELLSYSRRGAKWRNTTTEEIISVERDDG